MSSTVSADRKIPEGSVTYGQLVRALKECGENNVQAAIEHIIRKRDERAKKRNKRHKKAVASGKKHTFATTTEIYTTLEDMVELLSKMRNQQTAVPDDWDLPDELREDWFASAGDMEEALDAGIENLMHVMEMMDGWDDVISTDLYCPKNTCGSNRTLDLTKYSHPDEEGNTRVCIGCGYRW